MYPIHIYIYIFWHACERLCQPLFTVHCQVCFISSSFASGSVMNWNVPFVNTVQKTSLPMLGVDPPVITEQRHQITSFCHLSVLLSGKCARFGLGHSDTSWVPPSGVLNNCIKKKQAVYCRHRLRKQWLLCREGYHLCRSSDFRPPRGSCVAVIGEPWMDLEVLDPSVLGGFDPLSPVYIRPTLQTTAFNRLTHTIAALRWVIQSLWKGTLRRRQGGTHNSMGCRMSSASRPQPWPPVVLVAMTAALTLTIWCYSLVEPCVLFIPELTSIDPSRHSKR